ncbi:MAG: preprotein translocase subunit SecG [Clostridia bacterium]|nr:preprotein translocase subunit SecG [Clostridia bacterium]
MSALSIIIDIVLILISIVLIVTVLMQEGQRQGLGAIGGGAETFFGKNKAKSMEGRLQRYTKIAAAAFIVLAIVATIVTSHNSGSTVSVADLAADEAVEDVVEDAEAAVEEAAEGAEAAVEEAADEAEAAVEGAAEAAEEAVEEAEAAVEEAAEETKND